MKFFALTVLLLSSLVVSSQDYMLLEDVKLKKKDHFTERGPRLIDAVEYLLSTPVDSTNMDRKACTRFIIRYAEGTPFTTIVLDGSILKLNDQNLDLMTIFMGLWLKSSINSPKETDAFHEIYIYKEIYKYAKVGNGIIPTKTIKSLIKAGDKGELEKWIIKFKH